MRKNKCQLPVVATFRFRQVTGYLPFFSPLPQCFHFFAYVEAAGLWQGGWLVLFLGTFPLLASLKCVC